MDVLLASSELHHGGIWSSDRVYTSQFENSKQESAACRSSLATVISVRSSHTHAHKHTQATTGDVDPCAHRRQTGRASGLEGGNKRSQRAAWVQGLQAAIQGPKGFIVCVCATVLACYAVATCSGVCGPGASRAFLSFPRNRDLEPHARDACIPRLLPIARTAAPQVR